MQNLKLTTGAKKIIEEEFKKTEDLTENKINQERKTEINEVTQRKSTH